MAVDSMATLMAIALLTCARSASGAQTSSDSASNVIIDETFDLFMKRHGRTYEPGSDEHASRQSLFEHRQKKVVDHNGRSGKSWKETMNKFSDLTDQERSHFLGLRPTIKNAQPMPGAASFLETESRLATPAGNMPDKMDWTNLASAKHVANQGSCGSCWAVTTTAVLESNYEIHVVKPSSGSIPLRQFSAQELVNCVPNPDTCGGTGGCQGATVELGMAYIQANGLSSEAETPYEGENLECKRGDSLADGLGGTSLGLRSYSTLRSNEDFPLAQALVDIGPVAVSVGASDWFAYNLGIFHGCDMTQELVINHAVALFGYGKDGGQDYWNIRNSWGADWGENGYIRMLRHVGTKPPCTKDRHPLDGIGCKSGPLMSALEVDVCGMCGVLYDSVVPHFHGPAGVSVAEKLLQAEELARFVGADSQIRAMSVDSAGAVHTEKPIGGQSSNEVRR